VEVPVVVAAAALNVAAILALVDGNKITPMLADDFLDPQLAPPVV
jgi:hypothetical protein